MSESKHTPGPWADICGYITIRSGRNVASVNSHNTTEGKANALLIASAPDLIDVLRECEEYFDQRADAEYFPDSAAPHPNKEMSLLKAIRDAIGKAGA